MRIGLFASSGAARGSRSFNPCLSTGPQDHLHVAVGIDPGPVAPTGYVLIVDDDGAYITDDDGAYLMEAQ